MPWLDAQWLALRVTIRSVKSARLWSAAWVVAALIAGACGSAGLDGVAQRALLAPGEHKTLQVNTHCGYETLLIEINGLIWTTETLGTSSGGNPEEADWRNGHEWATFRLELIDDQTLRVTQPGSTATHTYHPDPSPPGCM